MAWIVAVGLVLAGLFRLLRGRGRQVRISRWMLVTTVDADGRRVGRTRRVRIKPPDRHPTDGAAHLRPYVDRLLASSNWFTTVSIFTPDGMRGIGLEKKEGVVALGLVFPRRNDPEREARARAFFRARGIEPTTDYVAQGDGTRFLDWPLGGDAASIEATTRAVLADLCGVSPEEGLDITYEEHRDRRPGR